MQAHQCEHLLRHRHGNPVSPTLQLFSPLCYSTYAPRTQPSDCITVSSTTTQLQFGSSIRHPTRRQVALIDIQNLTVDIAGVRQVVKQVLKGALASDNGLDKEAKHGEHSQAPVLDLLDLKGRKKGGQSSAWHLGSHCECVHLHLQGLNASKHGACVMHSKEADHAGDGWRYMAR